MQDGFTPTLRRFLAGRVDTLEQLEALLHLHRLHPNAAAADAIARSIGATGPSLERALKALTDQGLVGKDGASWRFAPADEDVRACVNDLAKLYTTRRIEVVNAVSAKALARVQALAEAFAIRKDKPK